MPVGVDGALGRPSDLVSGDDAELSVEGLGLAVQPQLVAADAPAGTAVETTPAEGTSAPAHSAVVLAVSAGPAQPPPRDKGKGHGKGEHKPKGGNADAGD